MQLLKRSDLCNLLGISSSTLDRYIQAGTVPKATHRLDPRTPRWSKDAVEKCIERFLTSN